MATATTAQISKTRKQLRQLIADELGDYMALVATANGTTTTFTDTIRLAASRESLIGRQWVGTSGANDGLVRTVSGGTTTLTIAAVTSTVTNDTADLYNKRGTGWLFEEYNRAINAVIEEAAGFALIDVIDAAETSFDADAPEVTVNASIAYVYKVEWQDDDNLWHAIPPATNGNKTGWEVDSVGGSIWILGAPQRWCDNQPLQIWGYGRQDVLSADTDACILDPTWMRYAVCTNLLWSGIDRDPSYAQKVMRYEQKAEVAKRRMSRYWNPDAKAVRIL